MEYNLVTNIENCLADIPSLLYYSHIPPAITVLLIGLFVYLKNKKVLEANLLLLMAIFFFLWVMGDVILWVSKDSRMVMTVWSMINVFEVMVSMTTLYFAYVFLEKRDAPGFLKIFSIILFIPLVLLSPTVLNLTGFDVSVCEAKQGNLIYYFYILEAFLSTWLFIYLCKKIFSAEKEERPKVVLFSIGILLFLFAFSGTNIIASVTERWEILPYGLFFAPVFCAFLAYIIVKYKVFNIKLFASQALVAALVLMIGSQLFFTTETANIILIGITWILVTLLGLALIRSVKSEIQRKEQLQVIAHELEKANEELRKLDNAKTEFLSIASHQLRTPLTAMKGYLSMLLEGSYGEVSDAVKDILNKVYVVNTRLARLVEELLNVSRIDAGRVQYNFEAANLEPILKELADTFAVSARERRLELRLELPKQPLPKLSLDTVKIKEVISNLVDNSLKYTKKGRVTLRAERTNDEVKVTIEDTGIGISPETLPKLFEKFSRSRETSRMEVSGTGLGLYVGKKFVEAHGGTLRAFSKGSGLGSQFVVALPVSSPRKRGNR